jgi:Prolyl oligopeptidase, N-terminal beta-propeller domain
MHGDEREDPFYWLRDDDRKNPDVLAHIKAENEYTAAALSPTEPLQARLFAEMRGRVQETDTSIAVRRDGFWYYTRTLEGQQYGIHCRRAVPEGAGEETEESTMDERCGRCSCVCHAPVLAPASRCSTSSKSFYTFRACAWRCLCSAQCCMGRHRRAAACRRRCCSTRTRRPRSTASTTPARSPSAPTVRCSATRRTRSVARSTACASST